MRADRSAIFPRAYRALIFDLDGVLTDTADTHYLAWKRLADEIAVPFDRRINERLKGVDRMASLEIMLERAGRAYDDREKRLLAERKNGYYRDVIAGITPDDLFPGVRELLADARRHGLRLGLASASRNAAALLERLGIADRFDCIADAALVQRAKPDPEIFLAAAAGLEVDPALCIGIEDAAAGASARPCRRHGRDRHSATPSNWARPMRCCRDRRLLLSRFVCRSVPATSDRHPQIDPYEWPKESCGTTPSPNPPRTHPVC